MNHLESLPANCHVVIVAPHPDDEVFGLGGTMVLLGERACTLEVVFVTDGEASHSRSSRITPGELTVIRTLETEEAWRTLGIAPKITRLHLPDGRVREHTQRLSETLRPVIESSAAAFIPIETDGHPDHDAIGTVALGLATEAGVPAFSYAVWAQLSPERILLGQPQLHVLSAELMARKRLAIDSYRSQYMPLGPLPEDGPVLSSAFIQHFKRAEETLWAR